MKMAKYIGLTIGPIYKTLLRAKKTRELWGASYLFSYLMKRIIEGIGGKDKAAIFISPYVNDPEIFKSGKEVGLFHDRFICQSDQIELDELHEEIISPLVKEVAGGMASQLGAAVKETEIDTYLNRYLNIYSCQIESDKSHREINEEMNRLLDGLELRSKFIAEKDADYLMTFLHRVNQSFLIKDAFKETRHSFPSIPEIAARDFEHLIEKPLKVSKEDPFDTDDTAIFAHLKKQPEFRTHHKYIAIVQADGDDLGKAIKGIDPSRPDGFESFSKALFGFAKEAHEIVKKHGGATIYAGGDDLLFFSPVVYQGVSVFEVCHLIGGSFLKSMAGAFGREEDIPTLSFGISISYYKFPMNEALGEARNLLFGKAKSFQGKHAIAFRCLKHSGTYYGGVLSRRSEVYSFFRKMIQTDLDEKMVTSVIHTLFNFKTIILQIGQDLARLTFFFENQFNEEIHKKPDLKPFFDSAISFIHEVCCTCKYAADEKIDLIFSVLRLKKHLKGEEDKE